MAISSRSRNDRYRPESGAKSIGGIPPPCRNHRLPADWDTPTAVAATPLVTPVATTRQNSRSTSRRSDGFPGDFSRDRPVSSAIHPAGLPINTSNIEVLRRPIESTLNPDDSFSFTFDEAGTFDCFCSIHPSMRAGITVTG